MPDGTFWDNFQAWCQIVGTFIVILSIGGCLKWMDVIEKKDRESYYAAQKSAEERMDLNKNGKLDDSELVYINKRMGINLDEEKYNNRHDFLNGIREEFYNLPKDAYTKLLRSN